LRVETLSRQIDGTQVAEKICAAYQRFRCDAVLLSSVSSDGIRLPVARIVRRLHSIGPRPLSVIDGAQELAHTPVDLQSGNVDVYLAGSHKWLGASTPLGMCYLACPETSTGLAHHLRLASEAFLQQDPLLEFLTWLQEDAAPANLSETVNLMPVACAAGALADLAKSDRGMAESVSVRRQNVIRVATRAEQLGWTPRQPSNDLRSGILLLQSMALNVRSLGADDLQARIDRTRVTITAYDDGLIRLAFPSEPLNSWQLAHLESALSAASQSTQGTKRPAVARTALAK
jgi:hypothetical protein